MNTMTARLRTGRRRGSAALILSVATLMVASPVSAGGFGPTITLRTAPTGIRLNVGQMAALRDNIVVGWREDDFSTSSFVNFVRWSTDGGQTFLPRVNLGPGDFTYGGTADICAGFVVALTGSNSDLKLVLHSLNGEIAAQRDLLADPLEGDAQSTSVTCAGSRRFVAAWNSPSRTKVAIQGLFESIPNYFFDLGPANNNFAPAVAATANTIHVAWIQAGQLWYKRFGILRDDDATIIAYPAQSLLALPGGGEIALGAYGEQVALAFRRGNDTRLQLSRDRGLTFEPAQTVVNNPDGGSVFASPIGAEIRNRRILLSIVKTDNTLALPDRVRGTGVLSKDAGDTWTTISTHVGGFQRGVLFSVEVRRGWLRHGIRPTIRTGRLPTRICASTLGTHSHTVP